jgi:hypothetical protein
MRDQHIMQGRGFILVYSITTRGSFSAMKELHRNILRVKVTKIQNCFFSHFIKGSRKFSCCCLWKSM